MKQIKLLIALLVILFYSCSDNNTLVKNETVVDADGNVYNVIKMGNQTWMVEN